MWYNWAGAALLALGIFVVGFSSANPETTFIAALMLVITLQAVVRLLASKAGSDDADSR